MYTTEQRERIINESVGKTVESLYWEAEGNYWVMTFTDETEMAFKFMAELIGARGSVS